MMMPYATAFTGFLPEAWTLRMQHQDATARSPPRVPGPEATGPVH